MVLIISASSFRDINPLLSLLVIKGDNIQTTKAYFANMRYSKLNKELLLNTT